MDKPRKAPAVFKKVSNVTEDDIRIRLLGDVIEKKENSIVLKDETGQMHVDGGAYTGGEFVRVFGRPIKTQEGLVIEAEMIQDMDTLDKKTYKRWEQQHSNRRFI